MALSPSMAPRRMIKMNRSSTGAEAKATRMPENIVVAARQPIPCNSLRRDRMTFFMGLPPLEFRAGEKQCDSLLRAASAGNGGLCIRGSHGANGIFEQIFRIELRMHCTC